MTDVGLSDHRTSFEDLFRGLDRFCDATLLASDGASFRVHRLFLSRGSGYFRARFRSGTGQAALGFDGDVLENVLTFLYTGQVHLDDRNVAGMVTAADYLLVDSLLMRCRQFALRRMSRDCCVSLLVAALRVARLDDVVDHCYRFVQVHFGSLSDECVAELPLPVLGELLDDDSLGVADEDAAWRAVVAWVEGDATERRRHVPELLPRLRWSDSLASRVAGHPFCRNLDLGQLAPERPRCPRHVYAFVRRKTGALEMFLTYDEQLDMWRKIGESDATCHVLVSLGRFLFLFDTVSNRMRTFDLTRKTWHDKECIRTSRQSYWVARVERRIYVVGGYVFMSNAQLSDVEYFEPERDAWAYGAPVPPMTICGASVVNEVLYVLGYEDTLEMRAVAYDAPRDAWTGIRGPGLFRTQFATAGFRDRLHVLGGRTEGHEVTVAVETYRPDADRWAASAPLPLYYEQPRAVVLGERLLVYDDCPAGPLAPRYSPCVWNASADRWDVVDVFSPLNEIQRYELSLVEDRPTVCELAAQNRDPEAEWLKTPLEIHSSIV